MTKYQETVLRYAFYHDVEHEIRCAKKALLKGTLPKVDLGFQFWNRHEPSFLEQIDDALLVGCKRVDADFNRRQDKAVQVFFHSILPALPVQPIDKNDWLVRAIRATGSELYPQASLSDELSYEPPLAQNDFLAPPIIEAANEHAMRLVALVRMYPIVFRSFHNPDRYFNPFATRGDGFECGSGWLQLIARYAEYLETMALELKRAGYPWLPLITQVKEKLGELTIHVDGVPGPLREESLSLLNEICVESSKTCERCGEPGEIRNLATKNGRLTAAGYVHCACDECEKETQ